MRQHGLNDLHQNEENTSGVGLFYYYPKPKILERMTILLVNSSWIIGNVSTIDEILPTCLVNSYIVLPFDLLKF